MLLIVKKPVSRGRASHAAKVAQFRDLLLADGVPLQEATAEAEAAAKLTESLSWVREQIVLRTQGLTA